jgi:ABC-type oligopeptide transport system substrate-binding subunit
MWAGLVGLLAVIVVGTSVAATGKLGRTGKAGVLRMSIGAEPPSLDAGLATDTTSSSILYNLMDPLIRLGPGPALKAEPGAAKSWTVKGAVVTLNLNPAVKWWNGAPTTAQDYVYSWLRTISPELGADYAYQFFGVKGAEAYNSCDPTKGDCNAAKAAVGIKAVGRYKLQITLTSPQPWFIQQLSHTSFLPVYQPAVAKFGNKFTEAGNFVGNGPFKLASWKHDASLLLVKNPKWRLANTVKLSQIQMQIIADGATAENAFDAGNIDVNTTGTLPQDIPKYKKNGTLQIDPALGTYYYGFNVKNISDVNQRRAMAFAIDQQAIIKYITQTGQLPAKGFTPRGIAGGPTIDKNSFQGKGVHGEGRPSEDDREPVRQQLARPRQDRDRDPGVLEPDRHQGEHQGPGVEAVPPVPRSAAERGCRRVSPRMDLRLPGCLQRPRPLDVRLREQQHQLVQQEVRRADRPGHEDA